MRDRQMWLDLFRIGALLTLGVFVRYGFDLRRKHARAPLAPPWLTRIMKSASCMVVLVYAYETRRMAAMFGAEFERYRDRVPAFIPLRRRAFGEGGNRHAATR